MGDGTQAVVQIWSQRRAFNPVRDGDRWDLRVPAVSLDIKLREIIRRFKSAGRTKKLVILGIDPNLSNKTRSVLPHTALDQQPRSTSRVGPPGPARYGPIAPRRLHARDAGSMCQPGRRRRPETAEGGGCCVCRSGPLDRRRGGVLRALHLRDQQGGPPFEGASDGGALRHDALMRTRSHRPRPGPGRRPSDPDEVRT
jgi:hypothetical protein